MNPETGDAVLTAVDAAPSLLGAGLRLGAAVALLAAGAWAWLYWQRKIKGPTRTLEVIDRAVLARGASVALLRAGRRRLLLGVSAEGVRLLDNFGGDDVEESGDPAADRQPSAPRFSDFLSRATGRSSDGTGAAHRRSSDVESRAADDGDLAEARP